MSIRDKGLEYTRRYLPAELAGTVTAIAASYVSRAVSDSNIWAAYAATLGENVGFYGTMIIQETLNDRRTSIRDRNSYTITDFWRTLRNLFIEFGPAEITDSLVTRPGLMFMGLQYIPAQWLGIFTGKVLADGVFYLASASSRELREKFSRK